MRSDRGTVRPALVERYNPRPRDRIEGAKRGGGWIERIDHQQPALAGIGSAGAESATRVGIVGDLGDRYVEALGLRIPCRLLKRQALPGRNDGVRDGDPRDNSGGIETLITICPEQGRERRVLG